MASDQASGISSEDLWAEHERRTAAKEALWQAWSEAEALSEAKQRALAAAGSALGVSLPQRGVVLALVWPSRLGPSRATVGRWVQHSAQQARGIREVLERACQRWVLVWCVDESVCHREPILLGVAPLSRAGLAAQRGPDRRGERGWKVSEAWPTLEHGMAAGGQGLARGGKLAKATRRQAQEPEAEEPEAEPPAPLTMGRDVLHPEREVERVCQRWWNRVEGQSEAAVKADAQLEQAKRRGQDPRGGAGHTGRAWRTAERLFDEAVQAQEAGEQLTEALGWFEASGPLSGRERAQAHLDEASRKLQGESWRKAKRMRKDARTLRHVARLHEPRRSAVPEPMVREALSH